MSLPASLAPVPMRAAWAELRAGLSQWRDRLLAAPAFHAWATRTPLLRHIARREARTMFDLCAGFVYSQVLFAVVRLDVLEHLRAGPIALSALSARLPLPVAGARTLIDAAVALRLLERRSRERVGLGARGAVLLANPGLQAMVLHHEAFYADLQDPVALLRGDQPSTRISAYWAYAGADAPLGLDDAAVARYSRLMALSQDMISQAVLAAYDFSRHRLLLDVGGGEGRFVSNVLRAVPTLEANVFDLPAVAARATACLAQAGHGHRASGIGGSFLEAVPTLDADLVTLVRVLHDHDDDAVMRLLRHVRRAVAPGGTLLIAEPMLDAAGSDPVSAAYFGFYLTAMRSGRPRSSAEICACLREAGYTRMEVRSLLDPLPLTLVIAQAGR